MSLPTEIEVIRVYKNSDTFGGNVPPHNPSLIKGIGRDPNNHKFIDVGLARPITDDELRDLHDYLREWRPRT